MRKLICIFIICFMTIAVVSGCNLLQKLGLQGSDSDELQPVSFIVMDEEEAAALADKVPVHLYFANEDNTKLKLEVRYIPFTEARKSVNNLAAIVIKELIRGPGEKSGLKATIPAGTLLRSPISISGGVATVDFTKEFIERHPGGKAAEQLTLYSVVNSLTELKEIQKVRFTIEGKTQKEFKGNYKFDEAFPRSISIISKITASPTPGTSSASDKSSKDGNKAKPSASPGPSPSNRPTATKAPGSAAIDDSQATQETDVFGEDPEETYIDLLE